MTTNTKTSNEGCIFLSHYNEFVKPIEASEMLKQQKAGRVTRSGFVYVDINECNNCHIKSVDSEDNHTEDCYYNKNNKMCATCEYKDKCSDYKVDNSCLTWRKELTPF